MIPQTDVSWQTASWQEQLAGAVRDIGELLALLDLDPVQVGVDADAAPAFPLRVPRTYLARIERGNPTDPLLLQVLPQARELLAVPGYGADPVGDKYSNVMPGIIHKYQGRVLLVASTNCAINCRYCFRREFPYADNRPVREAWQAALAYIAADPSITEVILSGGDPLSAGDRQLAWLVDQVAAVTHVERLRIHTRLPLVIPSRINPRSLAWMSNSRLQTVMVVHANHANELDQSVADAMAMLREAGVTLLNQSVLLKGVNDSVAAQQQLCTRLFEIGVLPYYLHVLDKVQGAAHFDVSAAEAQALMEALRSSLPGYLAPRLVREVAGEPAKVVLG